MKRLHALVMRLFGASAAGASVVIYVLGPALLLALLGLGKCAYDRHATAGAKVERAQSGATAAAAGEAAETIAAGGARDAAINDAVRKGVSDVRSTPGADAPVDPRAHAAGRAALCRLPAYRLSVACRGLRGDGAASVADPDPAR